MSSSSDETKQLAKSILLFRDQYDEPFACFERNGRHTSAPVRSSLFKNFLRNLHWKNSSGSEALSDERLEKVLGQLEASAMFEGPQYELSVRTAIHENKILVDMGFGTVAIDSSGWSEIDFRLIKFRRFPGMRDLVRPVRDGSLLPLLNLVNIEDEDDKLLLLVFVVTSFIPDIPHPVLAIHGPQGAAKSTLLRFLVSLIDPWVADEIHLSDEREFLQAAHHRWVIGLDNVSKITDRISDLLCKFVTGAAFSKRRLYTDDEDFIRSFRRVIILNGIGLPMYKADLLDRSIILPLERIKDEQRKDEKSLLAEFDAIKPGLLGAVFTALSKAMKFYPDIKLPVKPRLADFAVWGSAVAHALGRTQDDFLRAYQKNVERQTAEALEASPLATVILHYLKSNPVLSGSPAVVLKALREVADEAGIEPRLLPSNPRSFGRAFLEISPNLEARRYVIDNRRKSSRNITVYPPKPLLAASPQQQKPPAPVQSASNPVAEGAAKAEPGPNTAKKKSWEYESLDRLLQAYDKGEVEP